MNKIFGGKLFINVIVCITMFIFREICLRSIEPIPGFGILFNSKICDLYKWTSDITLMIMLFAIVAMIIIESIVYIVEFKEDRA